MRFLVFSGIVSSINGRIILKDKVDFIAEELKDEDISAKTFP